MDKNSLQEYGWTVIIVIILSALLIFASPFGRAAISGVSSVLRDFGSITDTVANRMTNRSYDDADKDDEGSEPQTPIIEPGLYRTGSNYTELIASWDELLADSVVTKEGHAYYGEDTYPTYEAIDALSGDLVLPTGITELAASAYDCCEYLTGVILPESLISIGDDAFNSCGLTKISIPCKVAHIGDRAFNNCNDLTEIVIPDSVISIGEESFEECLGLETAIIGSGLADCGELAFAYCINLKNVTIKEGATLIGQWMFVGCESLEQIVIPNTVTSIGAEAFSDCYSLTEVNIPASVTNIGVTIFDYCESLETITVDSGNPVYQSNGNCLIETATKTLLAGCKNSIIPADGSVTRIGGYAFSASLPQTDFVIPDAITVLDDFAFAFSNLTSITIPASVTDIGDSAFNMCTNLKSVIIQENSLLETIGNEAFYYCNSITNFKFQGTSDAWAGIELGEDWHKFSSVDNVVCNDRSVSTIS